MISYKIKLFQNAQKLILVAFLLIQSFSGISQDRKAFIELDFWEENGKRNITATAYDFERDSIGAPIEGVDLYFFVQRTFSLLPIGDRFNTTDENGEVIVEFPSDLPGDTIGNVTVIVKIEEADDYANMEVSKDVNWGIPLVIDHSESKRTLWAASANAPISLMILTNSLILIAWGLIFYIILKIYHISKM